MFKNFRANRAVFDVCLFLNFAQGISDPEQPYADHIFCVVGTVGK